MPEAWELTSSDDRIENTIATFIIFCEDENDEPFYFRSFETKNIKINCISNQKKSKLNLLNTLTYCMSKDLVECVGHNLKLRDGITENIWCVYDRDFETVDLEKVKDVDNLNFTTSINTANHSGLKVAWSNDAFELWVLLHFEKISPSIILHRNYIYSRLSDILKENVEIKRDFDRLIKNETFNYKLHLKKRFAFLKYVLPLLKTKTDEAIQNAEVLEQHFQGNTPFHQCNPCTKVHHLVNDILSASLEKVA